MKADMPYLWELAENQLNYAGERDRTINIKIAINTARMMVEREKGERERRKSQREYEDWIETGDLKAAEGVKHDSDRT